MKVAMRQLPSIPPVRLPQLKNKPTENQVEPTKHYRGRGRGSGEGGEREFHYKVYQNRTSALPRFCQLAVWRYIIGLFLQNLYYCYRNSSAAKKMWQRRNGEDTVCLSGGIGSYAFLAFMSQPFWKMHQSNRRTRGTGFGHTKSWPSSKPQWWGWKGCCCCCL